MIMKLFFGLIDRYWVVVFGIVYGYRKILLRKENVGKY